MSPSTNKLLLTLTMLLWNIKGLHAQSWMYMGITGVSSLSNKRDCIKVFQPTSPYYKLCTGTFSQLGSIMEGTTMALKECEKQFHWRRWNCNILNQTKSQRSSIGNTLRGTREAAFVSAILSAGISYAIVKDCRSGKIAGCKCDKRLKFARRKVGRNDILIKESCHDDIRFANEFSRSFVDNAERSYEQRSMNSQDETMMNLHNSEAGRMTIQRHMKLWCRCHGVSGSCTMKVCSHQTPPLAKTGTILMEKFHAITQVAGKQVGARRTLLPTWAAVKKIAPDDLVYLYPSHDYCEPNPRLNIPGTKGRKCKKDSLQTDGCGHLCCQRGYTTKTEETRVNCHCKFKWCCKVVCKKCTRRKTVHICK